MSDIHPYWSYGPDNGQPIVEALNEGRRAAALDMATRRLFVDTTEEALARAVQFEAYLKGDQPVVGVEVSEYDSLVDRSNKLLAMERRGESDA